MKKRFATRKISLFVLANSLLASCSATFLKPSKITPVMYVGGASISTYSINSKNGDLTLLQSTQTSPSITAMALYSAQKLLFTYNGSSITAFVIGAFAASTPILSTAIGIGLREMFVDPAGAFLYVSTTNAQQSYSINTTTGGLTLAQTLSTSVCANQNMRISPSGDYAYLPCFTGSIKKYQINRDTGKFTQTAQYGTTVPGSLQGVFVSPSGSWMIVTGTTATATYNINTTNGNLSNEQLLDNAAVATQASWNSTETQVLVSYGGNISVYNLDATGATWSQAGLITSVSSSQFFYSSLFKRYYFLTSTSIRSFNDSGVTGVAAQTVTTSDTPAVAALGSILLSI